MLRSPRKNIILTRDYQGSHDTRTLKRESWFLCVCVCYFLIFDAECVNKDLSNDF